MYKTEQTLQRRLTDDEIDEVDGNVEELLGIVQERCSARRCVIGGYVRGMGGAMRLEARRG